MIHPCPLRVIPSKATLLSLLLGLLPVTTGCHDHSAVEKQLADLRKDLDQLRTVQGNAGVLLEDLDNRLLLVQDQVDSHRLMLGSADAPPALPVVRLQPLPSGPIYPESVIPAAPQGPVVFADPRPGATAPAPAPEPPPGAAGEADPYLADLGGPIHYQLLDENGHVTSADGTMTPAEEAFPPARLEPVAAAAESDRPAVDARPLTLYKKGMALLQEKRHREAVAMFEDFLGQYPNHEYADNCMYWIGEAHYDRQMYHQALAAFEQVVVQHPRGNKVPDAMLKAAFCYASLGMRDRAVELFEKLIGTYPGTPAARLAEQRKAELL